MGENFSRLSALAAGFVLAIVPANAATVQEMHLLDAARSCDTATVVQLIDQGVSIEARSSGGHTPLIAAAFGDCLETVEELVGRGASITATDDSGYSAAELARLYGYHQIERALTGGASTQSQSDPMPGGNTADTDRWPTQMCEYVDDGECDEPGIGTGLCEPNADVADCAADTDSFPTQQAEPAGQTNTADAPQMCEQMYASCQGTCGYFTGNFQWVTDYSCMSQCSFCHDSCLNGQPSACTSEFRPWGGQ